jgi:hypothetical protein
MLLGRNNQRIKMKESSNKEENKIITAEEIKSCICQYGLRACGLNPECFCARLILRNFHEEQIKLPETEVRILSITWTSSSIFK